MDLETGSYYHLYNRSNNRELVFRNTDNYHYFLGNFRDRFQELLTVFAYCLMPTHFHFLIRVDTQEIDDLKQHIGIQLSAYTKAINNAFDRNGSLFQQHTKAELVESRSYLITVINYIHQNPIKAQLVDDLKSWPYSSYLDLAGYRDGILVDHSLVKQKFGTVEEFRKFSKKSIKRSI